MHVEHVLANVITQVLVVSNICFTSVLQPNNGHPQKRVLKSNTINI
jgi:hypothetical protein